MKKTIWTKNTDIFLTVVPNTFEYVMARIFGKPVTHISNTASDTMWISRCRLWRGDYYEMSLEIVKFEEEKK